MPPLPAPDAQLVWRPDWPVDPGLILAPLLRGRGDPCMRRLPNAILRATNHPTGPAAIQYEWSTPGEVLVRGWGPGADAEVAATPQVLGAGDDPAGFDWAAHSLMAQARTGPGLRWRAPRTGRTWEALVPAILEQRVTGVEARRAWAQLVTRHGSPAPGPLGELTLPPTPGQWARIPSWEYHAAGVDPGRARTLVGAARRAATLEELGHRPPQSARAALASLPGIGPWTAAEVAIRAWGDADAVSFGDFHLARLVVHSLTGATDGTDAQMAELLTAWAGQRARAVRMIELLGSPPPRRGPRARIADHRRH